MYLQKGLSGCTALRMRNTRNYVIDKAWLLKNDAQLTTGKAIFTVPIRYSPWYSEIDIQSHTVSSITPNLLFWKKINLAKIHPIIFLLNTHAYRIKGIWIDIKTN